MSLAQVLRTALERQGMRAVLTRQANEGPTYDVRAELANAHRNAVVITLHASSTGMPGTARVYFAALATDAPAPPSESSHQSTKSLGEEAPAPPPVGLIRWERAQQPFLAASARLAATVQAEVKKSLQKSPAEPAAAPLRDLRSIAAPAIAVELASVSVNDRKALESFLGPLAESIAQGIRMFRSGQPAGGT